MQLPQDGDTEYQLPTHLQDKPKVYFMDPLPNLASSMARFNTSYLEASVSSSALMSDLGKTQVATKKKVRSQFRVTAKKEVEKLADVSLKGTFQSAHSFNREILLILQFKPSNIETRSPYLVV